MATSLTRVEFSQDLLADVADFICGNEAYEAELAEWIRGEALQAMEQGAKVWLYYNENLEVVGYGSLGESRWKYPDPRSSKKTTLLVIPAVAIQKAFQGKPEGDRDQRYSSQIMSDLLATAQQWQGSYPALGLFVHPENVAAIKLYTRFEFRRFEREFKDPKTGQIYHGYVRDPI